MLYVPSYPSHLDNVYFEFIAKRFNDALIYDAVNNPSGLRWLDFCYPPTSKHVRGLRAYVREREYIAVQPDDNFRAFCYFIPKEPLLRIAAAGWQFDFDIVFFANLSRIIKTAAPQGMYHALLMEDAVRCIKNNVWGFGKELKTCFLNSVKDIFAEIENIDEKYLSAPYASFRLSYQIQIDSTCVQAVIPDIEPCFEP